MPTVNDLQHLREWTGDVFWIAVAFAVGSLLLALGLDWLATRRITVDEQAERRRLKAVTAPRRTR